MIRVALHVVAGSRGGPRTYGVALARALAARGDIDLVVLTDRPEAFDSIPTVKLKGPRPFADHVLVPRILKRLAPDIYHNTKNSLPFRVPCASVVTLHDLAYHHFPETFGFFSRHYLRFHHEHAARRADRIIAVSNHARLDMIETLGAEPGKVRVVHHGVAREFFETPPQPLPYDIEHPYILSVGTIQARKNLDVLVRAVARLREKRTKPVTLVIAGRRGWKTKEFDEACRATPVKILGLVPDEHLPALYAHAAVFVQPSSYEGFGLTVVEAMACGTPVIAADAGSLPEVVGDAGLLVPARDVEALARVLEQAVDHLGLVGELSPAGRKRAEEFTWERSADEHAKVYAELVRRESVPV